MSAASSLLHGDGALSMILVFLFLFCVSPVFPSRNDVSSCSLQKFLVSEKKIIPFFSRGTGVQVSLQVPVWGLLKNRSVLCQGLQKDVLIDWWRMSCSCTILFSFLYSERDLEMEMQVGPWEVVGPPHGTKRWGQWQRRNKDMSSEARGDEAFLCVLASHQLKVSDDQSETFNCWSS